MTPPEPRSGGFSGDACVLRQAHPFLGRSSAERKRKNEEENPRQRRPGRDPGRRARGAKEPRPEARAGRRKKATPGDDWKVAELYVERRGRRSIVGNIYKGRVDNVLPGMEAAFVDFGLERNGFLHVDEIVTAGRQGRPEARPRPRPQHRRADQARPGDRRPGRQGPPQDKGRAALDAALDRRPLPRLHAPGRRHRRLQARCPTRSASACAS